MLVQIGPSALKTTVTLLSIESASIPAWANVPGKMAEKSGQG